MRKFLGKANLRVPSRERQLGKAGKQSEAQSVTRPGKEVG
jgi:hypothetical protein